MRRGFALQCFSFFLPFLFPMQDVDGWLNIYSVRCWLYYVCILFICTMLHFYYSTEIMWLHFCEYTTLYLTCCGHNAYCSSPKKTSKLVGCRSQNPFSSIILMTEGGAYCSCSTLYVCACMLQTLPFSRARKKALPLIHNLRASSACGQNGSKNISTSYSTGLF